MTVVSPAVRTFASGLVRDVARPPLRATTLRLVVAALRAVFVGRCTTRRVAVVAVPLLFDERDAVGRGTTRRGSAIRLVRTTMSIGLFVWVTVVPGFNSVRI